MTAEEIFAKSIEKSGGKAKLKGMKDKTIELSGKIQNMDVKLKVVQKAPNKLYAETEMVGMFKQRQGFDGKKGWAASPQGTKDLEGEQLDDIRIESTFDFYGNYKALGFKAEVSGVQDVKGKECYEITFTNDSGKTMKQYFGTEDFLKYREVKTLPTPNGPIAQTTDFSDYKDFNGYLAPAKMEQSVMGQTFEFTTDKYEINKGISDKIFKKPLQ